MLEAFQERIFPGRAKIQQLGRETANEGTQEVEQKLDRLIEAARHGSIDEMYPSEFLESASLELWQERQSLEPILYLYEKYYSVRTGTKQDEGCAVGLGFAPVMSKIAAQTEGEDRNIIIDTTIDFFIRHQKAPIECINEVLWFARNLNDENLRREAKQIATFINKTFPALVTNNPFLQEMAQEILATKPQ